MKKFMKKFTEISWDYKSEPTFEELESSLAPFGIYVYEDPLFEGTDTYGYILSNEPLSKGELKDIGNRYD